MSLIIRYSFNIRGSVGEGGGGTRRIDGEEDWEPVAELGILVRGARKVCTGAFDFI